MTFSMTIKVSKTLKEVNIIVFYSNTSTISMWGSRHHHEGERLIIH